MDYASPGCLYWFIKIHGDLLEYYTRRQFISFYWNYIFQTNNYLVQKRMCLLKKIFNSV